MDDRVYVVQVQSLFSSIAPSVVMSGIFILNVLAVYDKTAASSLLILGGVGCVLNAWRIAVSVVFQRRTSSAALDRCEASRYEALFAVPYVSFAAVLGIFGFLVFRLADAELHMLTICIAVGYCAGVASTCGLRLPLAISSILLAIMPTVGAALMKANDTYATLAVVAIALIAGATRSMMVRSDEARAEIATRISSVTLARRDALTTLPNRLALGEYFTGRLALSAPDTKIAVHYLDLDGFKLVNDRHGHAAGDQLLLMVAARLKKTVRQTDMVARLGGDELAIVQFGLTDADEAYTLSWRVREAISQPYHIDQIKVTISTSIGTIVSTDRSSTLEALLHQADAELYQVKRARAQLRARTMT